MAMFDGKIAVVTGAARGIGQALRYINRGRQVRQVSRLGKFQVVFTQSRTAGQQHCTLNAVLQFAHISRPGVGL